LEDVIIDPSVLTPSLLNFSSLKELSIVSESITEQVLLASSTLQRLEMVSNGIQSLDLNVFATDLPMLERIRVGGNQVVRWHLNTSLPLMQDVRIAGASCSNMISLDWSLLPNLETLNLVCSSEWLALTPRMLPDTNRLIALALIFNRLRYIEAGVVVSAMKFGKQDIEVQILSQVGVQCLSLPKKRQQPFDYRVNCMCTDPPLVGASHCPRVEPLVCPTNKEIITIAQVCDGTSDCSDGYDEAHCFARFEPMPSSPLAAIRCTYNLTLQVEKGLISSQRNMTELNEGRNETQCFATHGVMRSWNALDGNYGTATMK
jgi:hypothetical protein